MLSLPSTIAPAIRRRATTVASSLGTKSARIFEPPVVRTPAVLNRSFNPIGTPWSAGAGRPATSSASARRAALSASSAHTVMKERRDASSAVMRSRWARTASTGETALVAIMRARSAIDAQQRSVISGHPALCGGLHVAQREPLQAREALERALDSATDRLELGVAPVEAGELGRTPESVEGDRRHAGQNTGRRGRRQGSSGHPRALQSGHVAGSLTVLVDPRDPAARRTPTAPAGTTGPNAAHAGRVDITATCGGRGRRTPRRAKVGSGTIPPPTPADQVQLRDDLVPEGYPPARHCRLPAAL